MRKILCVLLSLMGSMTICAQLRNADVYKFPEYAVSDVRHEIRYPSIRGLLTLKADMHLHTVFSDGQVWPTVRVDEAWREGLDVISITDHIEYTPYQKWVNKTMGASYEIAKPVAERLGIILISGAEITREKPDGHLNVFFITDGEKLRTPRVEDALIEAKKQGAFIMWNHPGWPDNISQFDEQHKQWIAKGLINGVEVYNAYEYYPRTIKWCKDYNPTVLGSTDMHSVSSYPLSIGQHEVVNRPMTLIFAEERSEQSVKKALLHGNTLACFNNHLAGREDLINDFFQASLKITPIPLLGNDKEDVYRITNVSDMPYDIVFPTGILWLNPNSSAIHRVNKNATKLSCEIKNLIIGEFEYLHTEIILPQ